MAIEFIPAVCPKCGGELRVPNNVDAIKCVYCGVDLILRNASDGKNEPAINISNYLILAKRAADIGNYKETYKYATLELEQEPFSKFAELYKGFASGMIISMNEGDTKEAIHYIVWGALDAKSLRGYDIVEFP